MDVFDLVAKIRLDSSEYESGVGKAKGTFSTLASGVKTGLATIAKVGAAAVTAGVAGVTALTKMGIEGYKSYEQLAGGAQLLWGDAYDFIANKASGAYKTVQMSQNDYLQQVNGFSTGLKTSLGGNVQAAAELADRIITAEADIVAATGNTQENVQNAFNGIMKSNFSMLDNLQLGITPTKEGFQQVIDKVNDWNTANGNATKYQIDNLADCQSALLDYIEMQGLSGYAAMEASKTIEGSLSMTKAAWSNLVVGMADENANIEVLINDFVESAATAAQNLLPRIEQTLVGIGQLITAMAPVIADALPVLVEAVLPSLLTAGVSLVTALVNGVITALPALYTALLDGVKIILVEVFGVSEEKAGEFADSVNSFFTKIKDGFLALVESAQTEGTWLNEIWTGLKETGKAFGEYLSAVWDTLSAAFKWCVEQVNTEGTVLNGIWSNIQTVISAAVSVIRGVIQTFTAILRGDWSGAWNAVKNIAQSVLGAIGGIISNNLNVAKSTVSGILDGIKTKFSSIWENCKAIVKNAVTALKNALKFNWELPKLKLPHISVTGGKAPYGIGGKGSLPKFNIEWYKKAYDNAMILSKPTIFGYSGGKFLGGGDGNGNEVVAGESYLMGLISNAVESKNERIIALLSALLEATVDGNAETVRALMADRTFAVGEREFARLVKQYA